MTDWRVIESDCTEAMAAMPVASVDAIVTDPPYGLEFMGKDWDRLGATTAEFREQIGPDGGVDFHGKGNAPFGGGGKRVRYGASARSMQEWHETWAVEALRVLKPGGHLLAFGGTRTSHRMVCAIEDAGLEIRDSVLWLYGSGFPKSLDVSKALDASNLTVPDAETWQGWGTALKPAHEPIVMARKPLVGTVAANVLAHGTGPLNIDGCRIEGQPRDPGNLTVTENGNGITHGRMTRDPANYVMPNGRWPANVLLDEEAAALLDEQTGERRSAGEYVKGNGMQGGKSGAASIPIDGLTSATYADSGGASRFFYCAKASRDERNAGLDGFEQRGAGNFEDDAYEWPMDGKGNPRSAPIRKANVHPTVKPIDLMRWLCRLVTPPGGTVLDPFAGSGTTGCAAALEGFDFIGIEREAEYAAIARARIAHWWKQPVQLDLEAA